MKLLYLIALCGIAICGADPITSSPTNEQMSKCEIDSLDILSDKCMYKCIREFTFDTETEILTMKFINLLMSIFCLLVGIVLGFIIDAVILDIKNHNKNKMS